MIISPLKCSAWLDLEQLVGRYFQRIESSQIPGNYSRQGSHSQIDKPERKTNEPHHQKTCVFAYAKTEAQISCAVTPQLISAYVFAT